VFPHRWPGGIMKKFVKFTSYLLMAAFFTVALSGCKKQAVIDPNANKIIVWSFEDEDSWKSTKKIFENTNKGYELVYQQQSLDDSYENRVLNSMLSGQGPDVWSMPNDWVYRHKEKLYPMPEEMIKTGIDLDKDFVPAIKQSVVFGQKIYALTPSVEPLMVFYNQKMFNKTLDEKKAGIKDKTEVDRLNSLLNEVPKTWSDFTESAKLLTKKDGNNIIQSGLALGTSNIKYSEDIIYLLMLQNDTKIISDNLKLATFNLPGSTSTGGNNVPGKRAIEFYTSFSNPNSPNYTWNDQLGDNISEFANGKVAMVIGYSSLQNELLQKYPDFTYKKAFVPQLNTDSDQIQDFASFNAFGVNKLSKNIGPSWNLVKLLSYDQANDFSSSTRLYTSKKAPSYSIGIKERSSSNPEKLSLATASSLVKGRYPKEFDGLINLAIRSINTGTQDPQSAIDLAANNITEQIREELW